MGLRFWKASWKFCRTIVKIRSSPNFCMLIWVMWEGHKTSTCIWNKSGLNLKLGAQCTNLLLRLVTRSSRVVSLIELPVSSFPHPVCTSSHPSGCLTYLKKSKCFSEKHSFYSVPYTSTRDALILLADSFYLVHTISHGSFFTVK